MLFNRNCGCDRQMNWGMNNNVGNMGCPIIEPAINKCIEKEFVHEVPQV